MSHLVATVGDMSRICFHLCDASQTACVNMPPGNSCFGLPGIIPSNRYTCRPVLQMAEALLLKNKGKSITAATVVYSSVTVIQCVELPA